MFTLSSSKAIRPILIKAGHIVALLCLAFAFRSTLLEKDRLAQTKGDTFGYILLTYNLANSGTFSYGCESFRDDCPPEEITPSNYREPMFPAILAAASLLHPRIATMSRSEFMPVIWDLNPSVHSVFRAVQWAILWLSAAMAMALVVLVTRSWIAGYVVCYLVGTSPTLSGAVPKLLSEQTAGMFLIASALLTALAYTREKPLFFALSGTSLGLLSLTKAQFLYILPAFIIGVLTAGWCSRTKPRNVLRSLAHLLVPYLLVVGAWSSRNYIQLGTFSIAGRGGAHLQFRLAFNEMTAEEWRASFLFWNPDPSAKARLRETYSTDSLRRFNDSEADSFRKIGKRDASGAKHNPTADSLLQDKGIGRIFTDPLKHIAVSLSMAYRSIFAERPRELLGTKIPGGLASLGLYIGAVLLFVIEMYRREGKLLPMLFMLFGTTAFFGLFSNSIPRYSEPLLPFLYASLGILGVHVCKAVGYLSARSRDLLRIENRSVIAAPSKGSEGY